MAGQPPQMIMMPQMAGPPPPQEEDEEGHSMPDSILDKYEELFKGFRHAVVHHLRSVDELSWDDESECIHVLMHLDAEMQRALAWVQEHRSPKGTDTAADKPDSNVNGKGDGAGSYL